MRIATYYDLPFGGAIVSMEAIVSRLKKTHLVTSFKSKQLNFNSFPLSRLWNDISSIFFNRIQSKKLAKIIDDQGFDIVLVSHDTHFQSPWILRYLKTKTVFICQEPTRAFFEKFLDVDPQLPLPKRVYEKIKRNIKKEIEIKNASYTTKIISNSVYSTESIFGSYGIIAKPIYLGVDTAVFKKQVVAQKNQVIIVGNNEPQKALGFAIEAVSKIDSKVRPKLAIVSARQRENQELLSLANKLKVKIEILQKLSDRDLSKAYSESKLTLAVAHLEPFGLSVIESLACGTPVVAVNEGGFKETVLHNKTGLLVERDSDMVAAAVTELLTNKEKRLKMSQNGIKDVSIRFQWKRTITDIEKVLNETI